jgi:hypothetical protein
MKGKTIKVQVINEWPQLKDILPLGFETELVTELDDTCNYNSFTFKGADGETYGEWTIVKALGYGQLIKTFKKI